MDGSGERADGKLLWSVGERANGYDEKLLWAECNGYGN